MYQKGPGLAGLHQYSVQFLLALDYFHAVHFFFFFPPHIAFACLFGMSFETTLRKEAECQLFTHLH